METKDTVQYHAFLQDIQTYRPQIVVVLRREEIPKVLQGQETYPTEPCSDVPNPCIALVAPWDTIEERNAAALVLGMIGPSFRGETNQGWPALSLRSSQVPVGVTANAPNN
ncbi:MAG: hypothetical protein WB562_11175 [Candidatus Sulfotelmatobacter sp.]